MQFINRRQLLGAGVAGLAMSEIPRVSYCNEAAAAQATNTRYDVGSPAGQAMLLKYERAVALMNDTSKYPLGDPRSWKFQWYTHWLPPGPSGDYAASSRQKGAMIATLPTQFRANAQAMWNTCQSHSLNPAAPSDFQEMFFFPWHRWYVYYFEQVIRTVLGDASFTLPYWNYLSGRLEDLSIPKKFQDKNSPLYRASRNPWVNAGDRVDQQSPGSMNLNALAEPEYIDSPDGSIGLCPQVDTNPHGLLHVFVGNETNMGDVPTAAGDPIFWLHHCNIDRIWESWNRNLDHTNPAWPTRNFVFADGSGQRVDAAVAGADRVGSLGYAYDNYITAPPTRVVTSSAELRTARSLGPITVASSSGAVELNSQAIKVSLTTTTPAPTGLAVRTRALGPGRQLYLTVTGLMAAINPRVVYNMYLDLPAGANPTDAEDEHYLTTIGFFGAVGTGAHSHRLTVNITDKVRALQVQNRLGAGPNSITLISRGEPAAGANAMIEQIAIVER